MVLDRRYPPTFHLHNAFLGGKQIFKGMEKISILGKDFAVTKSPMLCVSAAFFDKQAWSDSRIYSLSFSDSEANGKTFAELAADPNLLASGTSMRGSSPHHVPVVDTNVRTAILTQIGKTTTDFAAAMAANDETFFALYDKTFLSLYLNKKFDICKVTLNVATLTDGKFTEYISVIGETTNKATSRDVFDFENAIEKSTLSAVADILQNLEEDDEEEE